jgi:hypothetical protein
MNRLAALRTVRVLDGAVSDYIGNAASPAEESAQVSKIQR